MIILSIMFTGLAAFAAGLWGRLVTVQSENEVLHHELTLIRHERRSNSEAWGSYLAGRDFINQPPHRGAMIPNTPEIP